MIEPHPHEEGLHALGESLLQDPALLAEFVASQKEFFPKGILGASSEEHELARQRHLEWFLLDRFSAHLGSLPIESLLERSRSDLSAITSDELTPYLNSIASVFEVLRATADGEVVLRDLAGMAQYSTVDPSIGDALQPGDLVIGRIFATEVGGHLISRASGVFRNAALSAAIAADLERARARPRGTLRLSQLDLEAMFFQVRREPDAADAKRAAQELLIDAGMERAEADAVLERLAREPLPADPAPAIASRALRDVLDRLAFESQVDLEIAQRTLLHAWSSMSVKNAGAKAPETHDGATPRAIEEFFDEIQKRRAMGESIDALFDDLERKLDVADLADDEEEREAESPAPDFPGVVAAIVHEFLWEIEREEGAASAEAFACLKSFGRYAQHVGVLENLDRRDLVGYACFWLLEERELVDAAAARELLRALARFLAWADETQGLQLNESFRSDLELLETWLPAIVDANRPLPRADASTPGELFEVLEFGGGPEVRIRDRAGAEHRVTLDPAPRAALPVGTAFRGQRRGARASVITWYPAQVKELRPA